MALQTFTAGQVLTAAQVNALQTNDFNQSVSTKTANYVLVAADKGTRVAMNAATATTITVDTDLFNAGDTLFIQNIGAGVCTITAGTATVSTAGSLALAQNAGGTLYFTSAGVSIFFPTSQAGGTGGKLLQVVSTTKTDSFTMASTTYATITGLSATITPTSASSKILIFVSTNASAESSTVTNTFFQIVRGSTAIGISDSAGSRIRSGFFGNSTTSLGQQTRNVSLNFFDTPATTSATTYSVQIKAAQAVTIAVNRSITDTDNANNGRSVSTITLMEIGA